MQYVFGAYTLDVPRDELRTAGGVVRLDRQVLAVLTYLVQHHDRVVRRQELFEQLWPDRFVSDAALERCIAVARRAVGDSGRTQHVIQTVYGRGYRFVAPVEECLDTRPGPAPPATSVPSATSTPPPHTVLPPPLHPVQAGERRQVTVLCGTLTNTTALADQLGFVAFQRLVQTFRTLAQDCMQRYAGTIQPLGEEGFLALFGVPTVQEAHAEQAVQAALALQQRLRDDHAGCDTLSGGALKARVGVHTGWVVADSCHDAPPQSMISGGDITQGAMHLQTLALPGTVLVSDTTLRLLRGAGQSQAYGLVRVSGHAEPLMAYTVLGIHTPQAAWVLRPFVGRRQELAALDALLARALHGEGQVVGLVGEPGMGKSRLLAEFRQRLQGRAVTVLEGYCRSYTHFVPYGPLCDLLRSHCGLSPTARSDGVASLVAQTLREAGMSLKDNAPYLLQLLGAHDTAESLVSLTPEAIKDRTFAALRQLHLLTAQQRPLLLVVENLHWIDPTSEAYLASLVDQLAGAPLLLLTTYRPGYRPPWIEKSYATQLTLPRLTQEESHTLVRAVLPPEHYAEPLVQRVVAKAEGNPLFLEELAYSVREQGELAASSPVPETIRDVLAARIARLPEIPRRVLRIAAVLGRDVPLQLLTALWEGAGDLAPHVHELLRLELLYARPGAAEPVYAFKHVLTQEVAYEDLLLTDRQALHTAAGRALEARYATRLVEVVDQLAYHYARTEEAAKALEYLTQVADNAARGHAYTEALAALREALPHAERLPADVRDGHIIALVLRQADSLLYLGHMRESLNLLLGEQARLERLHDPTLAGPSYFQMGFTCVLLGERDQASQSLQYALAAAEQCGDTATRGKAHAALGRLAIFIGQYTRGVEHSQQAIALLEQTPERYWLGQAFFSLGSSYVYLGELALAQHAFDQMRRLGEAIGDRRAQSYAAWNMGRILIYQREYEAAIAVSQQALALATDPPNTAMALYQLGWAYIGQGEATLAISVLARVVQLCDQIQYRSFQGLSTARLSEAYLVCGDFEQAHDLALQGYALIQEAHVRLGMSTALRVLGRIALARGALAEAETRFQEALKIRGSAYEVGTLHLDLARLAHAQGNPEAVTTHLREAQTLFSALRIPKWVEHITQLASALGVSLPVP